MLTQKENWHRHDQKATIFVNKKDRWGIVKDGKFALSSYPTAEEAADAYESGQVRWPESRQASELGQWQQTKNGKGWIKRCGNRGSVTVNQARSGSWFWVPPQGGVQGWFETADEAKSAADGAA